MISRKSGHLQGGKFTTAHTTVTEAARGVALAANRLDSVRKISLGLITSVPRGPLSIKFTHESPGCLLAKVRGYTSVQELRIYTADFDEAKEAMSAAIGN